MRKPTFAIAVALLSIGPLPSAANPAAGVPGAALRSVNTSTNTVTLSDGTVYRLDDAIRAGKVRSATTIPLKPQGDAPVAVIETTPTRP